MSGLKDLAKGGWHPKGKGADGKESWRSDFKGVSTVAGWMGKGKDSHEEASQHQSTPLSTLKDPASFGPPPRRIPGAVPSPSSTTPNDGRLGAPPARQTLQGREPRAREEEEANKPPPGPYKPDTTGLSTAHLPQPPVRRPGQEAPYPPPTKGSVKPKPQLPPRLPPRQNSHPDAYAATPPPPYSEGTHNNATTQSYLNEGAMNRLGQAGVSVPGFNIGRTASPPIPPRQNASPSNTPLSPAPGVNRGPQLNELQSRFARTPTQNSTAGTSWAEKQAALKTASDIRNDPAKVSVLDMKSAASTASGVSQKYGITDNMKDAISPTSAPPQSPGIRKKAAPPPPPKKKELAANPGEPPPVPLGSKPKF